MNNINDLEYRLWLLQGEVNQARQSVGRSDFLDANRLNHLESEICYLQEQVAELKRLGQEASIQPMPLPPRQSSGQPLPYGQPQPLSPRQPSGQPLPYGQPQRLPFSQPQPPEVPGKRDLEKTLGTGIMGIVASVLIFISITIFGGLLLPYLTDVIMTAVMFLLSFILFGAGYRLLRKDPKNKFHISLCACGATAVCVSLFVTRLYFALINDGVFLALVVLWLALIAYICRKYQNYIFRIIGEIGIFLTVCLGTARFAADHMDAGSWFMFCMLLSVFGCSSFIFDRIISAVSYEKNGFSHSIRSLVFILLCIVFAGETDSGVGIYAGFVFVTAFLLLETYMSYRDALHDGCLFYCLMSVDVLAYCTIFCMTFELESFFPYYLAAILLGGFFEIKQSKNSVFGKSMVCLLFLWSGWVWLHTGIFYTVLVMLPLFAYGYFKKNVIPLYIGLFSIAAVFAADITVLSMVLLWAVPFVCFVVLARIMKNQVFTAVGYPWLMVCGGVVFLKLLREFDFSLDERLIIGFLAFALIHILLIKARVFAEDGIVFEVVAAGMTVCLMLCSAWAVYQEYLNVFTMLVMAALYTMNAMNLLKKSEKFGYYVGWKYTVLMILLVDAHFELSMLLSVLMLLFAAGSIAFGFWRSYRSFRIYGLILSMVSVFKLVLFDVSNKSTLYNAVGFLVCGLICFGISYLYNKIESRMKKK